MLGIKCVNHQPILSSNMAYHNEFRQKMIGLEGARVIA
ncbi:hypothetical protein AO382_2004 [Moraxella catarrhalis]|uniref:Uncharacterized protein n=1 Tax=Moraxella catarrhalis TaxID=480 RepID=A0A7Z0UWS9_MORCA|nr:hypothetical protein AO382_2004 [Moraxella catarrhalis]